MKKKHLAGLALGLLLLGVTGVASAAVVDFDDLPSTFISGQVIPDGYNGLNWSNMGVVDKSILPPTMLGTGWEFGVVSGNNAAFNLQGAPAVVSSAFLFEVQSAHFTAAWDIHDLSLIGTKGGQVVYSLTMPLDNLTPTVADLSGLGLIDHLNLSTSDQNPFIMDNFTFTPTNIAATPEPATLLLLGSGLAGMVGLRRKRQPDA